MSLMNMNVGISVAQHSPRDLERYQNNLLKICRLESNAGIQNWIEIQASSSGIKTQE